MKKRILVIRLGSLGDIVLTSPTIINLKIIYPNSYIIFLCKERYRPIVTLIEGIDEIVTIPDKMPFLKYGSFLIKLNRKKINLILDLHGNVRSWMARKIISARQKIVYPKRRYERILAVKKKILPQSWQHTVDLYNETIRQLGGKPFCKRPLLKAPKMKLNSKINLFKNQNKKYVVIAPGAAHPTKQWHIEGFADTARKIHRSEKVGIIWAITASETEKPSPVNEIEKASFLSLVDCPLEQLTEIISGAVLTIANDSGVAHISSSVGTPVIALFGPTHPVLGFAPRGLFDVVIDADEPCRPCSLHGNKKCYREERYCFNRIDSDTVYNEALKIIKLETKNNQAVFIDRDGTIIVDKNYLADPDEIEFIDGSLEALKIFSELGYRIVVVSNQSGVARGLIDIQSVEKVNTRLKELLTAEHIYIDAIYYCPHYQQGSDSIYSIECDCRKPAAGMVEESAYQLGLDLRKSYVIGDKVEDINLAKVIGAGSFLVRSGYGEKQQELIKPVPFYQHVKVVDNLLATAKILKEIKNYDKNR